ncbi:patatin-like phospholipase family protein [Spirillospora sp. CA-253888]
MTLNGPVAFVLSGGGKLAGAEIGMLMALSEAGIRPDLVVGSSAGALIGAVFAANRDDAGLTAVRAFWKEALTAPELAWLAPNTVRRLVSPAARRRAHNRLRVLAGEYLGSRKFADLDTPFGCNAFDLVSGRQHWFAEGPVVPALLAATAAPGLMTLVRRRNAVYVDGGLVDPVPIGRALQSGARTVYVLQVTDFDRPLRLPEDLVRLGLIETAARLRVLRQLESAGPGTTVLMLPLGRPITSRGLNLVRRFAGVSAVSAVRENERHMWLAYKATAAYLRDARISG